MYKKDYNARLKIIKETINTDNNNAQALYESLVNDLYSEENYDLIIELYDIKKLKHLSSNSFYTAFMLKKKNRDKDAERIYSNILIKEPDNTSVLNNLSIIVEQQDVYKAFRLIERAYELISNDEIISNNYNRIKTKVEEIEKINQNFKISAKNVGNENNFVRNKLSCFFENIEAIEGFDKEKNIVAIPNWQFKVLMKTDEIKADALRKQWIDKGYIIETNERNEHRVIKYQINPYIKDALNTIDKFKIKESWINGIVRIDKDYLLKIEYYEKLSKLNKVNKKFKSILIRDYNEFVINYLFENNKSVIVIAGSIIETLLIYYLEKQKIKDVAYSLGNKQVSKELYDAQLGDLLNYFEENNLLARHMVYLGNVTRLYRNYIHPGKELRESNDIDKVKAELCFNSVSELINEIIR